MPKLSKPSDRLSKLIALGPYVSLEIVIKNIGEILDELYEENLELEKTVAKLQNNPMNMRVG